MVIHTTIPPSLREVCGGLDVYRNLQYLIFLVGYLREISLGRTLKQGSRRALVLMMTWTRRHECQNHERSIAITIDQTITTLQLYLGRRELERSLSLRRSRQPGRSSHSKLAISEIECVQLMQPPRPRWKSE